MRQLYYQLVARDYVENTVKSYKRVGGIVSDARLAGLLDWNMIEDRGREVVHRSCWTSPREILDAAAYSFHMDHWEGQPKYVEVFVEKDALSGILIPVCRKNDVRFTANKGYSSSSALYETAKRFNRANRNGCECHLIYLGDHDPSGIDMTRDIFDRLNLFTYDSYPIEIHRLALNMDQVEMWNPPENPAKETDSRFAAYREEFGDKSWELDAVEPSTLEELVQDKIDELIDEELWEEVDAREMEYRNKLSKIATEFK